MILHICHIITLIFAHWHVVQLITVVDEDQLMIGDGRVNGKIFVFCIYRGTCIIAHIHVKKTDTKIEGKMEKFVIYNVRVLNRI